MRPYLSSLLVVVLAGCGRAELSPPASLTHGDEVIPSPPPRLRLTASFESADGFRFRDRAMLTTVNLAVRCGPSAEVHTSDGTVVQGEAARVDLQASLGRFFTLRSGGGSICLLSAHVGSLADVDPAACTQWNQLVNLQVNSLPVSNEVGAGLVLRTAFDGTFRLWVAESGGDGTQLYVVLDAERLP